MAEVVGYDWVNSGDVPADVHRVILSWLPPRDQASLARVCRAGKVLADAELGQANDLEVLIDGHLNWDRFRVRDPHTYLGLLRGFHHSAERPIQVSPELRERLLHLDESVGEYSRFKQDTLSAGLMIGVISFLTAPVATWLPYFAGPRLQRWVVTPGQYLGKASVWAIPAVIGMVSIPELVAKVRAASGRGKLTSEKWLIAHWTLGELALAFMVPLALYAERALWSLLAMAPLKLFGLTQAMTFAKGVFWGSGRSALKFLVPVAVLGIPSLTSFERWDTGVKIPSARPVLTRVDHQFRRDHLVSDKRSAAESGTRISSRRARASHLCRQLWISRQGSDADVPVLRRFYQRLAR